MRNLTLGVACVWATLFAAGVFAGGCGARGDLAEMKVKSAGLENVNLATAAAIGGIVTGGGDLTVEDTDGESHSFPVNLTGPTFGILLDASDADDEMFGLEGFGATVDVSKAERELSGFDLLGLYGGTRAGFHLGIGVDTHSLENQSDVKLEIGLIGVGVGFFAGPEWLTLDVDEDGDDEKDDEG
jgi:hypothetical protein